MFTRFILCLCVAVPLVFLGGCEDTVTLESFDQITVGMDITEVESIMGGEGELQQASGVGIGAGGMLEKQSDTGSNRDYLWGDENVGILVKFRDGKVYFKQKMGL